MPTNLMGVDVGFSKTRRTTGIACLDSDQLTLERAGTAWEFRKAKIPHGFHAFIIAIDGPLLPLGADLHIRRHVELLFIRAPFHITVGDPALVVIMASDWSCEWHPFRLPATKRDFGFFALARFGTGTSHQGVALQLRPVADFDTESLLLPLDKLLRLVRRHSR
jgi:hypothetical protein